MAVYVVHYSGRSYTLMLTRGDGADLQLGAVSFERDKRCWKGTAWGEGGKKVVELFGGASRAVRWITENCQYNCPIGDDELIDVLDDIIGIDDDESIELKVEYVPVPVYPIDICEVPGEKDLWQVRLRGTEFDHHGEPHLQTSVLGIFGADDEGWFTVSEGREKVHGHAR